jgi:hypothetical protein
MARRDPAQAENFAKRTLLSGGLHNSAGSYERENLLGQFSYKNIQRVHFIMFLHGSCHGNVASWEACIRWEYTARFYPAVPFTYVPRLVSRRSKFQTDAGFLYDKATV